MNTLTIDIKTCSCASIKNNGVFTYAQNNSTQVICVIVKKNQEYPLVWLPPELRRAEINSITDTQLRKMLDEADLVQAYDVTVEFALWKYTLCRLYPWIPEIPERKLSCIAAKAAYLGMNFPFRHLMKEFDLPDNELQFSPVDPIIFFSPDKKIKTETLSVLLKNCMKSVNAEEKIGSKLIELPPMEQQIWRACLALNDTGIFIRKEIVIDLHEKRNRVNEGLQEEFYAITGIRNPMDGDAVLSYLNKHGIPLKNLENENLEQLLHSMPVCIIRRVLEIRKLVAQNNPLRFAMVLSLLGDDSRVRGLWEYHGNISGSFRTKYLSDISYVDGLTTPMDQCVFRICRLPDLRHNILSIALNSQDQDQIITARNLKEHCKIAVTSPGKTVYYGKFKISCSGRFLKIVLPSGRVVYLYKPELEDEQLYCQIKSNRFMQRKAVSGSFLFHLLADAMVRDVVMTYLILLWQNCFAPVLTTSCEIVTEDPASKEYDEFFQDLISNPPEWLQENVFSPVMCLSKTWSPAS